MFHRITCPTCQHKFTVPEASMGQRQTCPNCQSLFLAGKSVADAEVPMKLLAPPAGDPLNKTMLGETEPPIKYNCPRCKKPLESPASEAGLKKPCPECGGRLQVPNPPPKASPMNKTMLGTTEEDKPAPATTTPASQPAAPAPSPGMSPMMVTGLAGVGVLVLALVGCVIGMYFMGSADREKAMKAQADFAKAKQDLDEFMKMIQLKEAMMKDKERDDLAKKKEWDALMEEQRKAREELKAQRDREIVEAEKQKNLDLARRIKEQSDKEKADYEKNKAEADQRRKDEAEKFNNMIADLRREIEANRQRQQQAAVIVSQPPPVVYPPYHWRYYYGW